MGKKIKRQGSIYSDDDVDQAENPLKAALIKTFIHRGITFEEFSRLHREYMLAIGTPNHKIASDRNNLLKVLLGKSTMTYQRFSFIMKNILKLNFKRFEFEFSDIENKEFVVSIDRVTY